MKVLLLILCLSFVACGRKKEAPKANKETTSNAVTAKSDKEKKEDKKKNKPDEKTAKNTKETDKKKDQEQKDKTKSASKVTTVKSPKVDSTPLKKGDTKKTNKAVKTKKEAKPSAKPAPKAKVEAPKKEVASNLAKGGDKADTKCSKKGKKSKKGKGCDPERDDLEELKELIDAHLKAVSATECYEYYKVVESKGPLGGYLVKSNQAGEVLECTKYLGEEANKDNKYSGSERDCTKEEVSELVLSKEYELLLSKLEEKKVSMINLTVNDEKEEELELELRGKEEMVKIGSKALDPQECEMEDSSTQGK